LEVAAGCRQSNANERLRPVLEAFGIIGSSGQQQLPFDEDSDEEDSDNDVEDPNDD
jgi:hypothetical protein